MADPAKVQYDQARRYGGRHMSVILPAEGEVDEESVVPVLADRFEVGPSGELILWGKFRKDPDTERVEPAEADMKLATFAPGQWVRVWATSALDNSILCLL